MGAAVAGNARNYGSPAKTRTASASGAKETVADTARRANGRFGGMYAANCGKLVSTRTGWANKAKETVAATGKPAGVACSTNRLITTRQDPGSEMRRGCFHVAPFRHKAPASGARMSAATSRTTASAAKHSGEASGVPEFAI